MRLFGGRPDNVQLGEGRTNFVPELLDTGRARGVNVRYINSPFYMWRARST